MDNMNGAIDTLLEGEMVDYIGYAKIDSYERDLVKFGGSIVAGYKYGISIGIALANSIVDSLPLRFDTNVACLYKTQCYSVVNDRLNYISSKLSSFLNSQGHRSIPVVAAERTNEEEALPTVSHKMIAHIAGLGWIGKNCLLITPDHGPRVRFVTVLTNAPLDAVNEPLQQRCGDCRICVNICPSGAIKGVNYVSGISREDRFDFRKCQDYFTQLKTEHKWDVCGMCLYACPYGKSR